MHSTEDCCKCADKRAQSTDGYTCYVDGQGYRNEARRFDFYCGGCKERELSHHREEERAATPPAPKSPSEPAFKKNKIDNKNQNQNRKKCCSPKALTEDQTCRVCFNCEINTVFVPCGHMALCKGCADSVARIHHVCPYCRANIGSVVQVFRVWEEREVKTDKHLCFSKDAVNTIIFLIDWTFASRRTSELAGGHQWYELLTHL